MPTTASAVLPPKDHGTELMAFRCPKGIARRIEEIRAATGYTLTELVVRALNRLIDDYDAEQQKKVK